MKNQQLKPVEEMAVDLREPESSKAVDIFEGYSPEAIQERLKKQAELRNAFLKHVKASMKKDIHYQPAPRKGALPYLKQEGSLLVMHFWQCEDDYEIISETRTADFYAITVKCYLRHPSGKVYVGLGWGNSKEYNFQASIDSQSAKIINSDYNKMPPEIVKEAFYNSQLETVQQMARKRALTSAARHLPFVSELFTTESENGNGEGEKRPPTGGGVANNSEQALKAKHNQRMHTLMNWANKEWKAANDAEIKDRLGSVVGADVPSKGEFVKNDELWDRFTAYTQEILSDRAHKKDKDDIPF